jgi:hypothetical protein
MLTVLVLRLFQEYDEGAAEAVGLLDGGIRPDRRRGARMDVKSMV